VIGDVVNVASRIEGLTKSLGMPIVVSLATKIAATDCEGISWRSLGSKELRGKSEEVELFAPERTP